MTIAAKKKRTRVASFEEQYCCALSEYAAHVGEAALGRAYELGRRAATEGMSLVEIASLHHRALLRLLREANLEKRRTKLLEVSAPFLAEVMSPYEMAHRGFRDSVTGLQKLNETLEEEIKRIAHAVHDEAGQLLVAVHLAVADISRTLPDSQRDKLARIEELLNQVESQLRRYSHELRPTVLDDLGWIPAIRFLADAVSNRAGLPIRVSAHADDRLPSPVEIALYRIVQEALTNVTRHAKAKRVSIRVRREGSALCCSIEDDGTGFDVRAIQSNRQNHGLGLLGIRERLAAIGGSLQIDSSPGRGTSLLIKIPVKQVSQHGD